MANFKIEIESVKNASGGETQVLVIKEGFSVNFLSTGHQSCTEADKWVSDLADALMRWKLDQQY